MRYLSRGRGRGWLVATALAFACLIAFATPAEAGVRAFRTSDGSEDASFVSLGAATTVARSLPDGHHGAYLIGRIVVNGGRRQIAHLRPDGTVDTAFQPRVRGGQVLAGSLQGGSLAIAGTFTAIGGQRRAGLALIDARTGRPLAWSPQIPRRVPARTWGDVELTGSTLLVSAQHRLYAWRSGVATPAWSDLLDQGQLPAALVLWHGNALALGIDPVKRVQTLYRINPSTGQLRANRGDFDHVTSLASISGHLVANNRGTIDVLFDRATSHRMASCGESDPSAYVVAVTGDAHTLYAGDAPFSLDGPGSVPGVNACSFGAQKPGFQPPALAYGEHGPIVGSLSLVGSHILVFTRAF
jgi:hypothetical protein